MTRLSYPTRLMLVFVILRYKKYDSCKPFGPRHEQVRSQETKLWTQDESTVKHTRASLHLDKGVHGSYFFHCLSIQSTDFFPGSSHLGTGLVMASPPSGLSHTHRIHGAGRKMLTWLGYFLMGSMAHHIYPYIAYMDPMGYQVLVIVSGMIPPWEITWRRHVSKCCGPHLVTYTSTLPYFSAAASCRPIRFFTIFQLMGKRVEP